MKSALMAAAVGIGLALPALATDEIAGDPALIAENPLLAELHASDPEAAARLLDEIEALDEATLGRLPKGATRGTEIVPNIEPDEQKVLDENPVFRELYARDRGATLKLIRLVIGE